MTSQEVVSNETASNPGRARGLARTILTLLAGLVLGVLLSAVAVWIAMPRMMIMSHVSPLNFDQTVQALQAAIVEEGWTSPGTMDLNAALSKHGQQFEPRVRIVKLCKAEYAADVLATNRDVSCLMPCSIAIWEDDDGTVMISKMNTGLMGQLFGGNVARVLGGPVATDEARILAKVVGD